MDNVAALLQLKIPVLDVYGSKTHPDILATVDRRAYAVYQTGNHHSRQIEINDANHFFQGHEEELLQAIASWMMEFSNVKQANKLVSSDNQPNSN